MQLFIYINQYNVRPDLPDLTPGNLALIFFSQKAPELFASGGNQRQDTAVFGIKDQIGYAAQSPAVMDIDYIFFMQLTEGHSRATQIRVLKLII